nr:hypothetical protein [Tanacetum cinerariifolium]
MYNIGVITLTPPSPPPSPLSPLSSLLPRIPPPPLLLPLPTCRDIIPEADMPPLKRARFAASPYEFEIGESFAAAASRQPRCTLTRGTKLDLMTALEEVKESVIDMATRHRQDSEEFYTRHQDAQDNRAVLQACMRETRYYRHMAIVTDREAMYARQAWTHSMDRIRESQAEIRVLQAETRALQRDKMPQNKTPMTDVAIKEWIAQDVTDALADYEANRSSRNSDDSHDSRSGERRTKRTTRECALTWWNSHVRTVGHNVAYALPWKTLMKMTTKKFCPRSEIKKLKIEMVSDESDKVEKYTGGLPDSIQGSVMASKPKTLQEAIELTRNLMDQKLLTYAARQAEKRGK